MKSYQMLIGKLTLDDIKITLRNLKTIFLWIAVLFLVRLYKFISNFLANRLTRFFLVWSRCTKC